MLLSSVIDNLVIQPFCGQFTIQIVESPALIRNVILQQ